MTGVTWNISDPQNSKNQKNMRRKENYKRESGANGIGTAEAREL